MEIEQRDLVLALARDRFQSVQRDQLGLLLLRQPVAQAAARGTHRQVSDARLALSRSGGRGEEQMRLAAGGGTTHIGPVATLAGGDLAQPSDDLRRLDETGEALIGGKRSASGNCGVFTPSPEDRWARA